MKSFSDPEAGQKATGNLPEKVMDQRNNKP